jgi:hypothetical protein
MAGYGNRNRINSKTWVRHLDRTSGVDFFIRKFPSGVGWVDPERLTWEFFGNDGFILNDGIPSKTLSGAFKEVEGEAKKWEPSRKLVRKTSKKKK